MPVVTRSQSNKIDIRVYKIVNLQINTNNDSQEIKPAIAILIIPKGTRTTFSRSILGNADYCKYRAECAYVEEFCDLEGKPLSNVRKAYSIYKPYGMSQFILVYTKSEFVYPEYYSSNINLICGGGIHFFKSMKAAFSFYITGSNNQSQKINIMPPNIYLPHSIYKPLIGNGVYEIYNDNGEWYNSVEYRMGLIRSFHFNHNNLKCITQIFYSVNSATDCVLVKTITNTQNTKNKETQTFNKVFNLEFTSFPQNIIDDLSKDI
jgi:hypothetical protein